MISASFTQFSLDQKHLSVPPSPPRFKNLNQTRPRARLSHERLRLALHVTDNPEHL